MSRWIGIIGGTLALSGFVNAFNISRNDNLAVYWGQDSANDQQRLSAYCVDDTIDTIPLAFLYQFFSNGNQPEIDFANTCDQWSDGTFSGTNLADCQSSMEADIKTCQAAGKIITISLGGATASVGFSSESQAESFAEQVWNEFLGGSSDVRPFGSAVLDGVDLDIENGSSNYYNSFVNKLRSLWAGADKQYYVTAAPQCPYPDQWIGDALNSASFDAVYVQFYNYCGLDQPSEFNFATWDDWARNTSPNPDVKVYIAAAASSGAAGTGYVDSTTLAQYISETQAKYSSFGGVALWDASEAWTNNRYDQAAKSALLEAGDPTSTSSSVSSASTSSTGKITSSTKTHSYTKSTTAWKTYTTTSTFTLAPKSSTLSSATATATASSQLPPPPPYRPWAPNHHLAVPKRTTNRTAEEMKRASRS